MDRSSSCFTSSSKDVDLSLNFFRRDLLRNIVPLRVLRTYADILTCRFEQHDNRAGAFLLLPASVSPFDRTTYRNIVCRVSVDS